MVLGPLNGVDVNVSILVIRGIDELLDGISQCLP